MKLQRTAELKALQVELRPFLSLLPKAKTAKIVPAAAGLWIKSFPPAQKARIASTRVG